MIQNFLVLTVVLAALTANVNAETGDNKEYRFVGFSTTPVQGNAGMAAMHADCQSTFHDRGARMCTTEEVFRTPNLEDLNLPPDESAWVQPIAAGVGGAVGQTLIVDQFQATITHGSTISCNGWTSNNVFFAGLSYRSFSGSFDNRSCSNSSPVACCSTRKAK